VAAGRGGGAVNLLRWLFPFLFAYRAEWEMPRNFLFLRCGGGVTRRIGRFEDWNRKAADAVNADGQKGR
jgi:hypothetical protein